MSTIQEFPSINESPIIQALLWQYNSAPALSSLITSKQAWYVQWDEQFWTDWEFNVFDLTTCNDFGLVIWAIILGVPLTLNQGGEIDNSEILGFNEYTTYPALTNTYWNFGGSDGTIGANFSASADSILLTTEQQRFVLRLKYLYLISRASIPQTNVYLNYLMTSSIQRGLFSITTPVANPVILTGTTTALSFFVTGLASTASLKVGMGVIGIGIVANTRIIDINSDSVITLSFPATASGSVTLDFGAPTAWVLENFNMSITYQFNFHLPTVLQQAIASSNVLPNPAGVSVVAQYWDGTMYVQFLGE